MKTSQRRRSTKAGRDLLVLMSAAAILAAIALSMLISRPAGAATGAVTSTTCYPASTCVTSTTTGSTSTTTGSTSTTTTGSGFQLVLKVSWTGGYVHWQVCGFPASAIGTTVQFFLKGGGLDGPVTTSGGSGQVLSDGCTSDPSFPLCPSTTTSYVATAYDADFDGGVSTNAAPLTVTPIGCAATTAASGTGTASSTGALAFTGSNVFRLIVFAALAILVGYIIVRLNRIRQRTG